MKPVTQSRISKQPVSTKQSKPKHRTTNYLQLSNEQFLRRNLMLLGVTQASFLKQTKCSLETDLFPKHQVNPTATKQFFYISYVCLQNLTNSDERAGVQMWYPPRTVNQQVEYKKAVFKLVQNLEVLGRVPKNMVVSKGTIMGDSSSQTLSQFLRFLSEMALRHQYLQKYSQQQRLIQVCCNHSSSVGENNINRFYIHPFVPSQATTNFEYPSLDLNNIKQVYQGYLKIYLKKLTKLRTKSINPVLADLHQNLIRNFMEQSQLSATLAEKVPKAILGENRAFDRRRIIDRNQEIWGQLNKMQCHYVAQNQIPSIKVEGEVDQILQRWQPVKGISNIMQANSILKNSARLRRQLNQQISKFNQLCSKIEAQIKK